MILQELKNNLSIIQLPRPLVSRFAPSPTGFLHLGHIVSAVFVWGVTKALGGKVLLRIEDHDQTRCRRDYEEAVLKDLAWLGLKADAGVITAGDESPFRQSNRQQRYENAIKYLESQRLTYYCQCTRRRIGERMSTEPENGVLFYDGHCRSLQLPPAREHGLRLRVEDKSYAFNDLWLGKLQQNPAQQCGDFLLRDRDQQYTYQFAVSVDDLDQKVNLVIRGQDLTDSTARQIYLQQLLGRKTPCIYLHHPLVSDESGKKLAKRHYAEAIAMYREQGEPPENLIGNACAAIGLLKEPRPITLNEVFALFKRSLT